MRRARQLLLLALAFSLPGAAAGRGSRFTLILEDPPLAAEADDLKDGRRLALAERTHRIRAAQTGLRQLLEDRKITVIGSTETLLNAVYVVADEDEAAELAKLPGVARVFPMLPLKRHMVRAGDLVRAPQGWSAVGGDNNAGAGVKIAVLDTGIDQDHPVFQDSGLVRPAGYPRCREQDCSYTNNKVIVARSYVEMLVLGDRPEESRPDDLSPRDRVGHGTAIAMVAAGSRTQSPLGVVSGVAPKAFLGNYKIFGSPGVNDVTFDDVVIRALEDAVNDGMDIATLMLGSPALWRPDDRGATCQLPSNNPCDPKAAAVENAARRGLTVVVSAGNEGDIGVEAPTLSTITTPGTAPAAITVGAITNANLYFSTLRVLGAGVPAELREISAQLGNGPKPAGVITAPIRDVVALADDGRACAPLGNDTLTGAIALVESGGCTFATKVNYAQRGGAVAVVVYRTSGDFLFPMIGLTETGIPAALVGNSSGRALKSFLAANPGANAGLDPDLRRAATDPNVMAYFSSYGPSIGDGAIKPEVVAPGRQLYMATQKFDPNGDMYSAGGYTAAQGTSFSAPMAAGAAALFKQRFPRATPAQVKSAVVNTATDDVLDFDASGRTFPAGVTAVGAGKLNAEGAARADIAAEPATLSFGILRAGSALPSRGLRLSNLGNSRVQLQLQVRPAGSPPEARVTLGQSSLALDPGATQQITVRLEGSVPRPGSYEGFVEARGGSVTLRVPYLYLVGDGVGADIFSLTGFGFFGLVNRRVPGNLNFKLIDKYGVPVADAPIRFAPADRIQVATEKTDSLGIGFARAVLGPELGRQEFTAEAGGLTALFYGTARLQPTIRADGVQNAASGRVGRGLAPGSYISIFGVGLSDSLRAATTVSLPLSLAGVSVSFDRPSGGLSLPGRLHFVSEGQINVQIPWELQGANDALMKVSIGDYSSALYTVPLNDYSPGFFEYTDPASGRLFIAALDAGFTLIGSAHPARRGAAVQLYANGLGPVANRPPSGEPSTAEPLSECRVTPDVTIGGRTARVEFCGLAPYNVGLYQLNVVVPEDAPLGTQPVEMTVSGVTAKTANLPIQ